MRVLMRAPLLSFSGYGIHSRQVYKWLETKENYDIDVQILRWGSTSWMINPDMEEGLVGRVMSRSGDPNRDLKYDITFQVQLPDEWDPELGKINVGISAVVETDVCNPAWIEKMNQMTCIVVPSNHIKRTIENTGNVHVPLYVIPEWYFEQIDVDKTKEIDLNLSTEFNFFINGTITAPTPSSDRKNTFNTVKWFCEAFKDDATTGLIIKSTMTGAGTRIDRQLTKKALIDCLQSCRSGEYPKVYLLHGNLEPEEICSIYKRPDVKCYLSLTRGEGFGLPHLEAAASGLPVMATNWSSHVEFLGLGKFLAINYELKEIPPERIDNRIFVNGMRWAEPSEEDFKKKIIKFRQKSNIPNQWAAELSSKIRENYSSSVIMKRYDNLLDELLG
tara:strand:+ start:1425 stop:2591 length:1167 start_codon:yes stop_codon:yes gene_type:complete